MTAEASGASGPGPVRPRPRSSPGQRRWGPGSPSGRQRAASRAVLGAGRGPSAAPVPPAGTSHRPPAGSSHLPGADASCATAYGPLPRTPSLAAAVRGVCAFFAIVTQPWARGHPTNPSRRSSDASTAPSFPLPLGDVLSQHPSARCTFTFGLLKILLVNHFAHIQNGEFAAVQTKLNKRGGDSQFLQTGRIM